MSHPLSTYSNAPSEQKPPQMTHKENQNQRESPEEPVLDEAKGEKVARKRETCTDSSDDQESENARRQHDTLVEQQQNNEDTGMVKDNSLVSSPSSSTAETGSVNDEPSDAKQHVPQLLHVDRVLQQSNSAPNAFNSASSGLQASDKDRLYIEHLQNHFYAANVHCVQISESDDEDYTYESELSDHDFDQKNLEASPIPWSKNSPLLETPTVSQPNLDEEYMKQLSLAVTASLNDTTHGVSPNGDTSSDVPQQEIPKLEEPSLTALQILEKKRQEIQEKLEQSSKQLLEEQRKTEEALQQQGNLQQKLHEMITDMRSSELPMNLYELYGEGIKMFDNKCSDLICCAVTVLMRLKPVVRYFLSSQSPARNVISVDYHHAEGSDGMTSDVLHHLVHQYWMPENAKYAVDTEIVRFLHKFFDRYYEDFVKWDLLTFLWFIIDNLQHENAALKNAFNIKWQSIDALCRQCGQFTFRRQKNHLSIPIRDKNLLIPVDAHILDLQTNITTCFSFSREEIVSGVRWKEYIMERFQYSGGGQLVLSTMSVKDPWGQIIILHHDETLTLDDLLDPIMICGWIMRPHTPRIVTMPRSSSSEHLLCDSETKKQLHSPQTQTEPQRLSQIGMLRDADENDKLPYLSVSIYAGNSRLFLPFLVQIGIHDHMLYFDEAPVARQIFNRLKPFAKDQKLDALMEDNNTHLQLNFRCLKFFFSEIVWNEVEDSEKDPQILCMNDDQSSTRWYVKHQENDIPTMRLSVSDQFFKYFDRQSTTAEDMRKTLMLDDSFHRTRHEQQGSMDYLTDALRRYFSQTKCSKCGDCSFSGNQLSFSHLPEDLIIELKRFDEFKRKLPGKQKHPCPNINDMPVWIPFGLDMGEFANLAEDELALYELSSIVSHSGHPTAGFWEVFARTENDKGVWWHNFQSYSCHPVELFRAISSGIYVLVYEKMIPPVQGQVIVSVSIESHFMPGVIVYSREDDTLHQVKERVAAKMNSKQIMQSYFFQFRGSNGSNAFLPDNVTVKQMDGMIQKQGSFPRLYLSMNQYIPAPPTPTSEQQQQGEQQQNQTNQQPSSEQLHESSSVSTTPAEEEDGDLPMEDSIMTGRGTSPEESANMQPPNAADA
eukprot:CAMPEP_0117439476 /NCGR_PEP_ID=MMETSP0759-20121206/2584_1 /TAXON_ID=63605 /ORGANISM="Percolomonas cosmopolitus, Strain WS" /LENGTH=1110 /DNA_ID=CAMNT_0005231191 /DNA_START=276 /DNA_END=3605 /DNA_ORIENTATION=+